MKNNKIGKKITGIAITTLITASIAVPSSVAMEPASKTAGLTGKSDYKIMRTINSQKPDFESAKLIEASGYGPFAKPAYYKVSFNSSYGDANIATYLKNATVYVNGTEVKTETEQRTTTYGGPYCDLKINESYIKDGKNKIVLKVDGYDDLEFTIQVGDAINKAPEFNDSVFADKSDSIIPTDSYYAVSFKTDEDITEDYIAEYLKNVETITVNGNPVSKKTENYEIENIYGGKYIYLHLNENSFKPGTNKVVLKAEGYEDLEFEVIVKFADYYEPVGKDITVKYGDAIEAINGISNVNELPEGTEYSFKELVDNEKVGTVKAVIVVKYSDNTTDEVTINVTVENRKAPEFNNSVFADKFDSIIPTDSYYAVSFKTDEDITEDYIAEYLKNVESITVNGNPVSKKTENYEIENIYGGKYIYLHLNENSFKPGTNKVVLKAEGYEDLEFEVIVKFADYYEPVGKDITVKYGDAIEAINGISNVNELPEGTEYSFKELVDNEKVGTVKAVIVVKYSDNTTDEVTINVTVENRKAPEFKFDEYVQGEYIKDSIYTFSPLDTQSKNIVASFLKGLESPKTRSISFDKIAILNGEKVRITVNNEGDFSVNALDVITGKNILILKSEGYEDVTIEFDGISEADRIEKMKEDAKNTLGLENILNYNSLSDVSQVKDALEKAILGIDESIDTDNVNGDLSYALISAAKEDGFKKVEKAVAEAFEALKVLKENEINSVYLTEEDVFNKTPDSIIAANKKLEEQKLDGIKAVKKVLTVEELNEITVPTTKEAKALLVEIENTIEDTIKKPEDNTENKNEDNKEDKQTDKNKTVKTGDTLFSSIASIGGLGLTSIFGAGIFKKKKEEEEK